MRLCQSILGLLLVVHGLVQTATAETKGWLFVSLLREKKIVTFERNLSNGELIRRGETKCQAEPAFQSVSTDRRTLYVAFRSTGELASYRIDVRRGKLTLLNSVKAGEDPAYILADKRGRFLIAAYYVSDKVTVHRLKADGSIGELLQTAPTANNAHGLAFALNERFIFVPHTGANQIHQFIFDSNSGKLTPNMPPFIEAPPMDHPRHICVHPSGKWAYTSGENADTLGVHSIDQRLGTLKRIQTLTSLPADFDGTKNAPARCEMSPNGRFVYVANRGHDSIACFSIDQNTGLAKSLGQVPTELNPRSFTIEPSGRFLYAAGQGSGKIAAFRVLKDGRLKRFATYESGPVSWWALAVDCQVH